MGRPTPRRLPAGRHQMAEQSGHARLDKMQRLFQRAKWDADAVRDDVRQVVVDRLGDPDGVLVSSTRREM